MPLTVLKSANSNQIQQPGQFGTAGFTRIAGRYTLTPTHSLYFLLVLIAISTHSSLEPFQKGISYCRMFAPNHLLFLFVLPS